MLKILLIIPNLKKVILFMVDCTEFTTKNNFTVESDLFDFDQFALHYHN